MDGDAAELLPARPVTRADCVGGERPCPWVSCWHHALHARLTGANPPADDDAAVALLEELPVSCVLDVTDAAPDGATFDVVADIFGVTRQRIHCVEKLAAEKAMARARRAGLDGEVTERDLDDVETVRPRRPRTAVRFAEERGPLARPPHLAHLPGFADVAPGADFWCGRIGAAVNTRLCGARRVATQPPRAGFTPTPLYRECAPCPDGAALALRLADLPAPPERRRLPVVQPPRLETPKMTTEHTNCDAKDCKNHRGDTRANSRPALVPFCVDHRIIIRNRSRAFPGGEEAVIAALRDGTLPPPTPLAERSKKGGTTKRKAAKPPAKAPRSAKAPRVVDTGEKIPRGAPVDGLALVRRMADVIARLGGIDAAEALADELAQMGGAA